MSYFVRAGWADLKTPLEGFKNQRVFSRQARGAYFFGLNLDYVSRFRELKEERLGLRALKTAVRPAMCCQRVLKSIIFLNFLREYEYNYHVSSRLRSGELL
jgi:hypothetical protein